MARRATARWPLVGAALSLTASLLGCGYAVVRPQPPFGAARIAVVPFLEDTPAGVAGDLAQALAEKLAASGVALAASRDGADAVLTGRVLEVRTQTAPMFSASARVPMYRVSMRLAATLTRGDAELWRTQVAVDDDFLPRAGEPAAELATEANRREALRRLVLLAAERLHEELRTASAAAAVPPPPEASDAGRD